MAQVFALLTLIVVGVIVADLLIHPEGTGKLINGITETWKNSLNATLGSTS